MKSPTGPPASLKIIAIIFFTLGLAALASALLFFTTATRTGLSALQISAMMGALIFCPSIVCIGIGLLRLSSKARTFALATVWIVMGATAGLVILALLTPPPGYQWQGQPFVIFPTVPCTILGVIVFALFYWKYCVLSHSKTCGLFEPQDY